jgi:hypothetical protein
MVERATPNDGTGGARRGSESAASIGNPSRIRDRGSVLTPTQRRVRRGAETRGGRERQSPFAGNGETSYRVPSSRNLCYERSIPLSPAKSPRASEPPSYQRILSFSARLCASAASALRSNESRLRSRGRLGLRAKLDAECGISEESGRIAGLQQGPNGGFPTSRYEPPRNRMTCCRSSQTLRFSSG